MVYSKTDTTLSFTQDFCLYLEYYLSLEFSKLTDSQLKWMWCDGIEVPHFNDQLVKKHITETQKIITTAFFGLTGQDKYKMTFHLGSRSLFNCLNDLDLIECLTDKEIYTWINLDVEQKSIEITLN